MTRTDPARPYVAVLLMIVSSFLTSIGDALVKTLTDDVSLGQLYVMRSVVALPILIAIIALVRRSALRIHRPGWVVTRSLLMIAMWIFFYTALVSIELAVASAGLYTFPLFLVLLSMALRLERVSVPRSLALFLGFIGVLLVLKPTSAGFTPTLLLPIGAAVCYALQALVTRYRCGEESAWVMSLGMNIAFPVVGGLGLLFLPAMPVSENVTGTIAFLTGGWQLVGHVVWLTMLVLGLIIVAASTSMAAAYQRGESSVIATFDYSHLIFASLWGIWFFNESIDLTEAVGMGAIAVAGIMVLGARRSNETLDLQTASEERTQNGILVHLLRIKIYVSHFIGWKT